MIRRHCERHQSRDSSKAKKLFDIHLDGSPMKYGSRRRLENAT
jgi:hypothetical protein